MTTRTEDPTGYNDNYEYLSSEMSWLRARVVRQSAERMARNEEQTGYDHDRFVGRATRRTSADASVIEVVEKKELEDKLRSEIDRRLEVHRGGKSLPGLGLDQVCEVHQLDNNERMILMVLVVPGIFAQASDVLGHEVGCGFGMSIGNVLGIVEPAGIEGWLSARKYVGIQGPLVRQGLVTIEHHGGKWLFPDAIWSSDLKLSFKAFSEIVGRPELFVEADQAPVKP